MACIISWILLSYGSLLRYNWTISLTPMEKTLGGSMEHTVNDYAPP
jgi:hypothetical protein